MAWSTERAGRDLEFVHGPQHWPLWPVLPLKREISRPPSEGFLYGDPPAPDEEITVFIGNIYAGGKLADFRQLKYSSTEEMLNDGWMVD